MARAKGSISPAERAALVDRERVLAVRRGIHMFHLLRERRGLLTLAQIRAMSRLLADHADALYRRADGIERGAVAARVPKALSLAALAKRVGQVGQGDDPVTIATSARLSALAERFDGRPATPASLRATAIDVLQLSEDVTIVPNRVLCGTPAAAAPIATAATLATHQAAAAPTLAVSGDAEQGEQRCHRRRERRKVGSCVCAAAT